MNAVEGKKKILLVSRAAGLRHLLKIHFPDHEVLDSLNRGFNAKLEYILSLCDHNCCLKSCLKRAQLALINPQAAFVICRPILASEDGGSKYGYWLSYMRKNSEGERLPHLMNPSLPCIHQYVDVMELKKEIIKTRGRSVKAAKVNAMMKSRAYNLSKKMKLLTGITLKAFQSRIMLCHALHDVFLTNLSIKEIAYSLSMHPNAFRSTFKRHFGLPPTQIRKMRAIY